MTKPSTNPWPSTPLDAAQRAFDMLTCPPAPLAFDGRGFCGLPQRLLPLDELKKVLIADATPRTVRDAVWRDLVTRSRRDGPAWVVAAAGIAMPGLRRMAGMLARGWHGDSSDDRDAELLTGFLQRLRTIDLTESRIVGKLIDAGARAVKQARERDEELDTIRVRATWSLPPRHPWDHPDWVLGRAVAHAVIDPDDHRLISATRLDHIPLQVIADELGITAGVAATWRRRAERRLADAIRSGELDWTPLVPAAARRPRTANAAATGTSANVPDPDHLTTTATPAPAPARARTAPARGGRPAMPRARRPVTQAAR